MSSRKSSLVAIAQLLGAEGFTDRAASEVRKFYRNRVARRVRGGRNRFDKVKAAFGEVAKKLSDGDRLVMGRYIGMLLKAQFETGLRLGLITHIAEAVAQERVEAARAAAGG